MSVTRSTPAPAPALVDELRGERDRFVAFAFASADILVELDGERVIRFVDGATSGLLGQRPSDLIGTSFLDLIGEEEREEVQHLLQSAHMTARLESVRVHLRTVDGAILPFMLSGFQLPYLNNHYFLSFSVIRAEVRPEQVNKRDFASGLLRKDTFAATAAERMREAEDNGQEVKMTLLDFPELQELLDRLDPQRAKELLRAISQHLRELSVDGDAAGILEDGAFGVVHNANVLPDKVLKDVVALTRKMDPQGIGITMNSHTLELKPGKLDPTDAANALLYTVSKFATERGESFCIHSLSESYEQMLEGTVDQIARFKQTIVKGAFQVAFQPIVDLKDGRVHHYESLVRLEKDSGFSNPFEFVTFGEQTGIIGDFDLAMCQRTLEILDEAAHQGYKPSVSVNLSGRSMGSTLFKDSLRRILAAYPRVRSQIIFEITESSKIQDLKVANQFVQELRGMGNLFCLDDFGVGESSFDYLRGLQVDFIKIDGSYVKESLATERGRHMLRAMAALCKDLGIVTIGEMVEDEKVAAFLWESGVRFGQGYLFGKPSVDVEAFIKGSQETPFHKGMLRARRISNEQKKWWTAHGPQPQGATQGHGVRSN